MSWTKNARDLIAISSITLILYSFTCAGFYFAIYSYEKSADMAYDSNTIRATYPNYASEDHDWALSIFEDYAAPKTSYRSFIAYRRQAYDGEAVIIGEDQFRKSINHSKQESVWFLGGSTMWGTGADDSRTIPSFFAKATGEKVLNLGETAFTSLQELIQLQILLSRGYTPEEVIFYDGVNDGFYFCQKDSEDQIRHAATARWTSLKKDRDKAEEKLKTRPVLDLEKLLSQLIDFYKLPLTYFRSLADTNRNESGYLSNVPIRSMSVSNKYLHCDDTEFAKKAARITIQSWRSAAAILKERNIPVWFVLQPTATFKPEEYKLDHIRNSQKQAIVNEARNYSSYYSVLKSEFFLSCEKFGDCQNFIDLSELFFGTEEYLFIDTCHISPNGNELISDALLSRIRKNGV